MDAVSTTSNLTKEERESIRSRINQSISFTESVDLDFFLSFMNHDVSDTNILNFKDKNSSNSLVHFKYIFVFQFEPLSPQYPAPIVYIENSTDGKTRKEWAYILNQLTQKLKENDFITVFHACKNRNKHRAAFILIF